MSAAEDAITEVQSAEPTEEQAVEQEEIATENVERLTDMGVSATDVKKLKEVRRRAGARSAGVEQARLFSRSVHALPPGWLLHRLEPAYAAAQGATAAAAAPRSPAEAHWFPAPAQTPSLPRAPPAASARLCS